MSKLDNVHQPDQVAGTVLSKEFYADKPLNSYEIYALFVLNCYETYTKDYCNGLVENVNKLLRNSKEDYQYTSTEFAWLLDMVNYTLQVIKLKKQNILY